MKLKKSPDDEWLRFFAENYRYDPASGSFWKAVGCADVNGYVRIGTRDGDRTVNLNAHNLAFFLMTGEWPAHPIDHINRIRTDNRWSNLRQCSYSDNNFNRPDRPNKTGYRGVTTSNGSFHARIGHKGVTYNLGLFPTAEEAANAYRAKARELYGDIAV